MPTRGSAIGAMKGSVLGGLGKSPSVGSRNSFGARATAQAGPSISGGGGYSIGAKVGGRVHPTVLALWGLCIVEVLAVGVFKRAFRAHSGG
jgi:hypothetical protein